MHYLLFYDVVPEYLERRGEYRGEHMAFGDKPAMQLPARP